MKNSLGGVGELLLIAVATEPEQKVSVQVVF